MHSSPGNAVELIVAILALVKCELQVVQSSLIGSILSNLLLVLGMVSRIDCCAPDMSAFADRPPLHTVLLLRGPQVL